MKIQEYSPSRVFSITIRIWPSYRNHGASFRSKEEVLELSGCDLLTISPSILEELTNSKESISQKLDEKIAKNLPIEKIDLDEKTLSS